MSWMDSLNAAVKDAGKKGKLSAEQTESIAQDLVTMSSFGAAAVTLVPIPFSDFVAVTAVQASMVTAIGRIHGRELTLEESKHLVLELASVCGAGLVAQKGFATLTKFLLPGLGGVLAAPWAFAVTWGMGNVAMHYFRHRELTREVLKGVFDRSVKQAKSVFTKEKFDEFRKKHGDGVADFVRQQGDGSDEDAPVKKKKKKKKKKLKVKVEESAPETDEDE
ncbi:MAG: DUF697 domain-containing protein [Myxococcaceae bacterium]